MKAILVTGGAGFIGSNFIPYFLETHQDYKVINLDLLTYAGNLDNLSEVENNSRYEFVKGDIVNRQLVEHIFTKHDIRGVIHFAAESHVDNSITDPEAFVRTNVHGTFTLVDVARKYWMDAPFSYKKGYEDTRFLHVSTDEVYGTLGETGLFTETTPYAPNSPYSASKAGSDLIVRSYFHTYGFDVVITNCSNNFGEKQHHEKLIPTIIRKALSNQPIPIYGNGQNIRDWLYVLDHAKGIDKAFHKGEKGESYNIGSNNEWNNLNLAKKICSLLDEIKPKAEGKYEDLLTFVKDRPGHDLRYAIDSSKIENELDWKADTDFDTALTKTINWYIDLYNSEKFKENAASDKKEQPKKVEDKEAKQEVKQETKTEEQPKQQQATKEPKEEPVIELKTRPIEPKTEAKQEKHVYQSAFSTTGYDKVFDNANLNEALEALAEVKAAVIRTRKDYEFYQEKEKDAENKAKRIIAKAQEGNLDWNEANNLAMELLKEQERSKQLADGALNQLAELGKLQDKMEKHAQTVKSIKEKQRVKMPDSSETISMIERMKAKIQKDEVLGDLYEDFSKNSPQNDPILDKKVNDALGIDPEKDALNALKSKLGMNKK
ncbi:dTDP-glucose 4,6-dehydratase [Bernardetia sp.]|uniref:dTDP-glucose 4,6-dehydratase n=1 Tax=Bernardetia sp. TaxID=1937974 RepID=UPI0025BF584A|nr:dTDP-glucose 4,6-dehydratase [Bernardetia sp.]